MFFFLYSSHDKIKKNVHDHAYIRCMTAACFSATPTLVSRICKHILVTLSMVLLHWNGSGIPCTSSAQHSRTHLVQLLLINVVVIVRLCRHSSMLPPYGIEGAHQDGGISTLSNEWSKSLWINDSDGCCGWFHLGPGQQFHQYPSPRPHETPSAPPRWGSCTTRSAAGSRSTLPGPA
jgi:hypothetical protein